MTLREILRYTGTLYGANMLASLVTFAVTILISRDVTRTSLGMYGLFQAYFLFGSYATSAGLAPATVRWVASASIDDGEFLNFIAVRLAIITAFLYCGSVIAYVLHAPILAAALFALPAYHVFNITLSAARARLKRQREAVFLVVASLATSAWIVGLLLAHPGPWAPIMGQVAGAYTVTAVIVAYSLRHGFRGIPRLRRPGAWRTAFWRTATPIFFGSTIFALGELADRLVIEHLLGLRMLGIYVMALTLFNVLNKPVHMLSRVLLSHFSQGDNGSKDAKAGEIIRLNLLVLPLMGLTAATILPWFLPLVFNRNYSLAFPVFAVLTVVIVVKAFELVHSSLAVANDSAVSNMRAQLVALSGYGLVVFALTYNFGLIGLAWAVVIRWMILAIVQRYDMHRQGVDALSLSVLARATAVYMAALSFFSVAPWFMGIAYLVGGSAVRVWSIPRNLLPAGRRI
ncbi:MAG: lipopolysaccharide biosynthesis protein [Acidiferrobacter sp.]